MKCQGVLAVCFVSVIFRCSDAFWGNSKKDSSFNPGDLLNFGAALLPKASGFMLRLIDKKLRPSQLRSTTPECNYPTMTCDVDAPYRTADGYCNNLAYPARGTPGWPFKRLIPPVYDDGVFSPRTVGVSGRTLPSARQVSRVVHAADHPATQTSRLTSMFTQFGQFLDHDLDLTPLTNGDSSLDCCERHIQFPVRGFYVHPPVSTTSLLTNRRPLPGTCFPISVPQPDNFFNNISCMNFVRSKPFAPTYKCKSKTREQGNAVTSYIDGSQIYGSTLFQQKDVREFVGGRLRETTGSQLPVNSSTTCRSTAIPGKKCAGAGDVRVNEQPMLTALHTVFHRFHNHIADYFAWYNSHWDDEKNFQETRKIMGAVLQHITYTEYLPLVIGPAHIMSHRLDPSIIHMYEPQTDPRIMNSFATAAFRFGHSMIPSHLKFGTVKKPLESLFFCPHLIQDVAGKGLDDLLKGTITERSQGSDRFFSPAVSEKLFQDLKEGRSLDLAALNIQRGRDHGLAPYNDFREACGLPRVDALMPGSDVYLSVYETMDDVDLFSGALSEPHVPGGIVGDTFACIIAKQFRDLKFGDRYWYENLDKDTKFTEGQLQAIKKLTLASLFCTVTGIGRTQPKVFSTVSYSNPEMSCDHIEKLDLTMWISPPP